MNNTYLERARKVITDPKILSIVAGKRARQLAWGARPMLKSDATTHLDVALLEIAEGKLYYKEGEDTEVTDIFADIAVSSEAAVEALADTDGEAAIVEAETEASEEDKTEAAE